MTVTPKLVYSYRFSGGSLDALDKTYVVRAADRQFYQSLKAGEFCYVFNARQMGKSSLRVRTMYRLQQENIACADIDLTGIVSPETTSERLYLSLIKELVSCFRLRFNRRKWWSENNDLPPVLRFEVFLEEILLQQIQEPIVIFVDEIDSILRLNFPIDDFFALIRACYNKRADKPAYQRLTWTLLGVATPSELIQDAHCAPFNIGQPIELTGFQLSESLGLAQGFVHQAQNPQKVLQEILKWTGGQPFLTQKLCWIVATTQSYIRVGREAQEVGQLVQQRLIENWQYHDEPPHLKTIRNRLLDKSPFKLPMLLMYLTLLQRGKIPAGQTPEHRKLLLCGLVVNQGGWLKIYNPIYRSIFSQRWVRKHLPKSFIIPIWEVLLTSIAAMLLIMGLRFWGGFQGLELYAFDYFMRKLPAQSQDERLLLVGVNEADLREYTHPLPDTILAQLLNKLQQYQPAAIGLDIVRDQPVPAINSPGYPAIKNHLQQNEKLITICAFAQNPEDSIAPPRHSPDPQEQVGFVNLFTDQSLNPQDDTVRRYLLSRTPNPGEKLSACQTHYSLAWQLVYLYLDAQGIETTTQDNNWKFGNTVVQRLNTRSGGYQTLDARGNQLLIRYRKTGESERIARQVSVRDILTNSDNFNPNWVKNRIVLIGVTAPSVPDFHDTLYGNIRGIYIHAHAVSHLLSVIEDNQPLFWWLPLWVESLWVWFWSGLGAVVVCHFEGRYKRSLAISLSLIFLSGCCWVLFVNGGWVPLIPSGLALVLSSGIIIIYMPLRDPFIKAIQSKLKSLHF